MSFNPEDRLGKFQKTINAITNDRKHYKLQIKGFVIGTPGKLRYGIGDLKANKYKIDFGDVIKKDVLTDSIKLINPLDDTVRMTIEKSPEITLIPSDSIFLPKERKNLLVKWDVSKKNYGKILERIYFRTKAKKNEKKAVVSILAHLREDFSSLSEKEREDAPKIFFEKTSLELGNIAQNEEKSVKFVYRNNGKRDLIIRNITSMRKEISILKYDKKVKPKKTGEIAIRIKSEIYNPKISFSVTVISNDPKNSELDLHIYGEMRKP